MGSVKLKLMKKFAKNMLFFGKTIRPKIFEIDSPRFHKKIAAYLRREKFQFLNILAPRGFAKTTLVGFIYAMWHIFVEDFANGRKRRPKFIVFVSKSRPHAISMLQTVKNCLEYSDQFTRIFGYYGEYSAKVWREDKVILKDGTILECRGMGQQVRGMNYDSRRPTLIILDDAEDENNTKTEEAIAGNRRWFLDALSPMIKRTYPAGRIVNIGTPQHQSCLVFLLKDMKEWTSLHFRAISKDEDGNDKSLWPEMMSLQQLYDKRDSLEEIGRISSFYREYMCEVVGDSDSLVTNKDLRWWNGELRRDSESHRWYIRVTHRGENPDERLDKPEEIPIFIFMGVDPASALSARADYSVVFLLGVDSEKNLYCLHYHRERVKPMRLANIIVQNFEEYKPERTRIESVGYQEMIRDYLREEYPEYIPGIEIKHNPRTSKSHRLESLQTKFARHKVFIKKGMEAFTDELLLYPRAKHDDTLDGFYYAQLRAYGPTEKRTITEQQHINEELKHFLPGDEPLDPSQDWLLA